MNVKEQLRAGKKIARYHLEIGYKRLAGKVRPEMRRRPALDSYPEVTVLVTAHNSRYPLELTLRSLRKHTSYPNYHIRVAHNGSTDGTVEMVQGLAEEGFPITLIDEDRAEPQWWWYDAMTRQVSTPYWVGLHQDMYFLSGDWLLNLVARMEQEQDVMILSGERVPAARGIREPVKGALVDVEEKPSTWIFCARRDLRERIRTSWMTHKSRDEATGRVKVYEHGGKLVEDMRTAGVRYDWMPSWYALRYQHIGNLSWVFTLDRVDESVRIYKQHQIDDIERRARRLRRAAPGR